MPLSAEFEWQILFPIPDSLDCIPRAAPCPALNEPHAGFRDLLPVSARAHPTGKMPVAHSRRTAKRPVPAGRMDGIRGGEGGTRR
jgi:hypothetical protein